MKIPVPGKLVSKKQSLPVNTWRWYMAMPGERGHSPSRTDKGWLRIEGVVPGPNAEL